MAIKGKGQATPEAKYTGYPFRDFVYKQMTVQALNDLPGKLWGEKGSNNKLVRLLKNPERATMAEAEVLSRELNENLYSMHREYKLGYDGITAGQMTDRIYETTIRSVLVNFFKRQDNDPPGVYWYDGQPYKVVPMEAVELFLATTTDHRGIVFDAWFKKQYKPLPAGYALEKTIN